MERRDEVKGFTEKGKPIEKLGLERHRSKVVEAMTAGLPELQNVLQGVNMIRNVYEKLDQEWVDLIWEARELGMTLEEVKAFFIKNKQNDAGEHLVHELWQKSGSA